MIKQVISSNAAAQPISQPATKILQEKQKSYIGKIAFKASFPARCISGSFAEKSNAIMQPNYILRLSRFFIILAFIFSAWKASANSTTQNFSLYYFSAFAQNNTVEMKWKTTPDMTYTAFIVQYSKEGFVFDTLAVVVPSSDDTAYYTYIHLNPTVGANYYRLGMVDLNGTIHFSAITDITLEEKKPKHSFELLQIFPIPAADDLNFTLNCTRASTLNVMVLSENGKTILSENLHSYAGTETHKLNCSDLVSGNLYTLLVTDENGFRQYRHILKK